MNTLEECLERLKMIEGLPCGWLDGKSDEIDKDIIQEMKDVLIHDIFKYIPYPWFGPSGRAGVCLAFGTIYVPGDYWDCEMFIEFDYEGDVKTNRSCHMFIDYEKPGMEKVETWYEEDMNLMKCLETLKEFLEEHNIDWSVRENKTLSDKQSLINDPVKGVCKIITIDTTKSTDGSAITRIQELVQKLKNRKISSDSIQLKEDIEGKGTHSADHDWAKILKGAER